MRVKKEKRGLPLKEILFSYLALSKVLYWLDMINSAEYGDFWSGARVIWSRLINRDILLIVIVILFFVLEKLILKKSKQGDILKQALLYVAGFVGVIGLFYIYLWVGSWFVPTVTFPPLLTMVVDNIIGYILVVIMLNIKIYFKTREKETYQAASPVLDADNDLVMLQALFERGILTQEEFDCKSEGLRHK